MHFETLPDRSKLQEKEVDNLKRKTNFLEAEDNALKAENDKQMKNERLYITMRTSLEIKSILKKLQI